MATSDVGPLPSIVSAEHTGTIFPVGDPNALFLRVKTTWESPGSLEVMSTNAREEYEVNYSEESNYRLLMSVYDRAIAVNAATRR